MNPVNKDPARSRAWAWGVLGLLFCLGLVLAPDLVPALIGKDGYVWTPINSPLYRVGDNYYYAAWVAEVIRGGFPPGSPSAAEYAARPLLESLRWFPLAVAAIPSLFSSDFRVVYILDYVFTVSVLYGIPCYMAYRLTKSTAGGVLVGVIVLFFGGQWYWDVTEGIKVVMSLYEYETLNSFRYINLSISAPILMAYVALCHILYASRRPSYLIAGSVLLISPCMAFSYPSHTLIAYAVLVGYSGLAYVRGHRLAAAALFSIAVLTASVLVIGGYVGHYRDTLANNELWNSVFNNESMTLVDRPWQVMARMVLWNKFTLHYLFALWLTWKNRELRDIVLLLGSIAFVLQSAVLFDMPQLSGRFTSRGIDHLWLAVYAIACLWGWQQRFRPWLSSHTNRWLIRVPEVLTAMVILAVPALGFGSYALASANNSTRFMPQEQWQTLEWINGNVLGRATVAALDWNDITFIPIYTRAYLAVDNMIIGGRGPADEIRRYAALWKILGFPRDLLEARLRGMVEAVSHRWKLTPAQRLNPPFVEPEIFASGQIAEAVLYWPYVPKVGGIEIAEGGKTAAPFVRWVMALYDEANPIAAIKEYGISYVLLSGVELNFPLRPQIPLELTFQNQTHAMYRVAIEQDIGEHHDLRAHVRSVQ